MFIRSQATGVKIFYAQLKNPTTGVWESARSTRTSSKSEAQRIARKWALEKEDKFPTFSAMGPKTLVTDYVSLFWDLDRSPFLEDARDDDPSAFSSGYFQNMGNYFQRYLALLVRDLKLEEMTPTRLRELRRRLKATTAAKLKPQTINDIMRALTQPLRYAAAERITRDGDPTATLKPLPPQRCRRGVLSARETRAMADFTWKDPMAKIAFKVATVTGMRMGEVRGLTIDSLELRQVDDRTVHTIVIHYSYSATHGLKCPKNGETRAVTVSEGVWLQLHELAQRNPHGDGLVFWSSRKGQPYSDKKIRAGLSEAMTGIGIDASQQEARNLHFHGQRAFFNSTIVTKYDPEVIRLVLGHKSEAMTEVYFRATNEQLADFGNVQEQVFGPLGLTDREVTA